MEQTLKNFKQLTTEELMGLSYDSLSENYKESLCPTLFATAFIKLHKLAIHAARKYPMITEEDVLSFSLEKLDVCLRMHDSSKASMTTYYTQTMLNRYREEAQSMNTHKRVVVFNSASYESMVDDGFDIETSDPAHVEFIDQLHTMGLSEKELAYCILASQDYSSKMIAERLSVSLMTISNLRKKLQAKLTPSALIY